MKTSKHLALTALGFFLTGCWECPRTKAHWLELQHAVWGS